MVQLGRRGILLVGVIAALSGCFLPPRNARVGEPAPAFELPTADGAVVALTDFRDKVVVVDFWATWCGPCHIQAAILEKAVIPKWRPRGVEFLAINVGESADTVRAWLAQKPASYPVLLDEDEEVFASVGGMALPTLLVIGRDGRIAFLEAGIVDEDDLGEILARSGV